MGVSSIVMGCDEWGEGSKFEKNVCERITLAYGRSQDWDCWNRKVRRLWKQIYVLQLCWFSKLILEFLEDHTVDISFRIWSENYPAFLAINWDNKYQLLHFIKYLQVNSFSEYVLQHKLLEKSIVQLDLIGKSPLVLSANLDPVVD